MKGSSQNSKHVIYLSGAPRQNAGGPNGYVWNLETGLAQLSAGPIAIERLQRPSFAPVTYHASKALGSLRKWRAAISVPGAWLNWKAVTSLRRVACDTPANLGRLPAWAERRLHDAEIRSILANSTASALQSHRSLLHVGRRSDVGIVLITHSPEMPAVEKVASVIADGVDGRIAELILPDLMETDLAALRVADLLIFPAPEAMEPYLQTSENFADAIVGKDVRFVPTGIQDPSVVARTADRVRASNALRLAFVGRHNTVKGYDLLCRVVPKFLDVSGASMTVAGAPSPALPSPRHPRWSELGRIPNPAHLILDSDVIVLPNQRTYFDLIALETMALARPLLASDTGGNKALARVSPGVILFDPTEDGLLNGLQRIAAMSPDALAALGLANRKAFEANFTATRFASAYRQTIEEWHRER